MVNNTVMEDHFDNLVKALNEASSLLSRLGKGTVSDDALLSDAIKHLNDSSGQLYFVRRDSEEDINNIEALVNEAFRQATEQLIEIRENRSADSLRCISTLTNVALRMATERLVAIRTVKD